MALVYKVGIVIRLAPQILAENWNRLLFCSARPREGELS